MRGVQMHCRRKKWTACLLAGALALSLLWGAPSVEVSADYTDPYMDRMVELGLMYGDSNGDLRSGDPITRAEFATIVNRAFGYERRSGTSFQDVGPADWFAEDVDIAYTEGYMTGTSPTTFSPNQNLTREEAAYILARNLMMEPGVGADTSFTDSRDISAWSRGLVSTAVSYGLVSGYPDGSFQPQRSITRGETAVILLNAIGTPVQEPGVQSLGNVWGNVTITTSGVTLRDTVVAGNLYVSAGVDLGDVVLENVRVLGEIVVSGGGVSEAGDDSVVLRNVDAPRLIVDNIRGQHVSIRVEGDGVIDRTSVRTNAFLSDNTPSGAGLSRIELDGEEGAALDLAGNVKQVVNLTPGSSLSLTDGRAESITVDEAATDSVLNIVSGSRADQVNLDVAAAVTGDGDIGQLVVNAPGSTVSMLPDQITIRPGVTAVIDGVTMDSQAAAESSADPRLLAGSPAVTDLAPNSATITFTGNKSGTVHWAVTALTDGSADVDDLLHPQSYATSIVASGTVSLSGANQPATARVTRLTSDGSYYLACVLVDAREDQSPLKVISFTTPDDSEPEFADGYPYLSRVTSNSAQVTVMTTKTCRLYWAVLPEGAQAPDADDFKANAVSGNLGFGTRDMEKNVPASFSVNDRALEELEDYVVYLWLTDVDGAHSSRVEALDFTTVDGTPPRFNTEPTVNEVDDRAVGLYANLNEDGVLYWVVVPYGETYPKPLAGQSGPVDLSSDTAKLQVSAGMNALDSGRVNMREGQDVDFRISGLEGETAYDLYYVAQDEAGNFSDRVGHLTIHTLDDSAPTVTQEFTEYNGDDRETPLPSTDIRLVFSEAVEDVATNVALSDYYAQLTDGTISREQWGNLLRSMIKLYVDDGNGPAREAVDAAVPTELDKENGGWVVDYRYVQLSMEDGRTVLTFPTEGGNPTASALNLASGGTYYFEIQPNTIADTSDAQNTMGRTQLDKFTTVFATVNLSNPNITMLPGQIEADISWRMTPVSTGSVMDNMDWDMIIWSDTSVAFKLYGRKDGGEWEQIGSEISITVANNSSRNGYSLTKIKDPGSDPQFAALNTLEEGAEYEYAIHFTRVGTLTQRDTWSQRVTIGITVLAGSTNDLRNLANGTLDDAALEGALDEGLTNIGLPDDFALRRQFSDQTAPTFVENSPYFVVGDSFVEIYYTLDRPGTVYYVVAPKGTLPTTDGNYNFASGERDDPQVGDSSFDPDSAYSSLPERGDYGSEFDYEYEILNPTALNVLNAGYTNPNIKYDSAEGETAENWIRVEDLQVHTDYIAYFVIQSESSQVYSDQVYAYRFTTSDVEPAYITMRAINPEVEFTTSQDAGYLYYALYASNRLPAFLTSSRLEGDNLAEGLPSPENDEGEAMTFLEAMLETYASTGESCFDHFASAEAKERVRLALTSQSSSEALGQGNIQNMTQGEPETQDFEAVMNPESATAYICLATAQNRLGGDWTFKAVDGVRIPDEEPPVLVSVDTAINAGSQDGSISGIVTLHFSEPIYHINQAGDPDSLRTIVQGNVNTGTRVGFLSLTTDSGANLEYRTPDSNSATSDIILNFWDASVSASFSFCTDGHLADANANSRQNDGYTLTLREVENLGVIAQGVTWEFVVTRGLVAEP